MSNILGPQIFIMLGGMVLLSGVMGIISIIICGAICTMIAMIYAELGLSMPTTSLVIDATNDAFGGFASFVVGWSQLFGNISFAAVSALGFGLFIGKPLIGAFAIIIFLSILQLIGMNELGKIENYLILSIILFFLILIFSNIANITYISNISLDFTKLDNWKKIILGVSFFFLAFTGFEDVTSYSEELKDVKKLPLVMFLAIITISVLFLLIYLLLIGGIQTGSDLALNEPLVFLSQTLFKGISGIIIRIIGIFATISSLMAVLNTSARNVLSMSEKGFLPKMLFKVTKKGIPINAILLSCVFSLTIVLSGSLDVLVYLANFIYFFITIILSLSLMKLRKKREKLARPFKIPFYKPFAWTTIGIMILLTFFLNLKSLAFGFIWLFFGFILYVLRIVGEYRLKIAIIGANIISSAFFVIILFALKEVEPVLFMKLRWVIIIGLIFFLIFSFLLVLDAINDKKNSNIAISNQSL
ncbi:APC family permease [archaeon]|nr:APC family permease [archaeon]